MNNQISVKLIAHSVTTGGQEICTFELEYPRFIHAEFLTHRVFSRNSASSRAIPIDKMIEQVENNPAMPLVWGVNQSGMQASSKLEGAHKVAAELQWCQAAKAAAEEARKLQKLGLHKQIVNRVLEPFQRMKTVMTTTDLENFFWLRCHKDAQPEIQALAEEMRRIVDLSTPMLLKEEEWHLPYIYTIRTACGTILYLQRKEGKLEKDHPLFNKTRVIATYSLEVAQRVSASCCAQVSYRSTDMSISKAQRIYNQLVEMQPVHASPFEHQATPMEGSSDINLEGVTSVNSLGECLSGNLRGWVQLRQSINNHHLQG